jgi:predicted PolB exonuclease-like 3'-5' exonuclease
MSSILVFDLETVPDTHGGRRLWGLDGLSEAEVAEAMFNRQRQSTGRDFLRPHLQRVAVISLLLRSGGRTKIWSLHEGDGGEKSVIERFFAGLERYRPVLVSWNGSGFDLPVLHYRSLLHGVAAPVYWDVGEGEREARWNNYLGRFHWRHIDLMDVLAGYQARAYAPLDELATLAGLPGKMGMDGSQVWESYVRGDLEAIRRYCETDVLNTYGLFLRFELMRGRMDADGHAACCRELREWLLASGESHLREFAYSWSEGAP